MSKPVIKKSELISMINDKGMTRAELAEFYNVSVGEINKYLKILNIKLKAKKMTYEVIDDTTVTPMAPVADLATSENVNNDIVA